MENKFYVYRYSDQNGAPFYVGKGSGGRFHIYRHLSNGQLFLKRKIRKIGADNVKIHFLHKNLTETEAFQFETFYIGFYGRRDLGEGTLCNLTDGGEGGSGYKYSEEAKRKISERQKGRKFSKKTRQKMSESSKNKKHSKEALQKMSKATKGKNNPMYGKKHSKKTKMRISDANKGKKHSEETRQKISEANKGENNAMYGTHRKGKDNPMYGKTHTEKAKRKMSEAKKGQIPWIKGKHHSEETRRKMSKAKKLYLAKKKNPPKPILPANLTI